MGAPTGSPTQQLILKKRRSSNMGVQRTQSDHMYGQSLEYSDSMWSSMEEAPKKVRRTTSLRQL